MKEGELYMVYNKEYIKKLIEVLLIIFIVQVSFYNNFIYATEDAENGYSADDWKSHSVEYYKEATYENGTERVEILESAIVENMTKSEAEKYVECYEAIKQSTFAGMNEQYITDKLSAKATKAQKKAKGKEEDTNSNSNKTNGKGNDTNSNSNFISSWASYRTRK